MPWQLPEIRTLRRLRHHDVSGKPDHLGSTSKELS